MGDSFRRKDAPYISPWRTRGRCWVLRDELPFTICRILMGFLTSFSWASRKRIIFQRQIDEKSCNGGTWRDDSILLGISETVLRIVNKHKNAQVREERNHPCAADPATLFVTESKTKASRGRQVRVVLAEAIHTTKPRNAHSSGMWMGIEADKR